MIRLTRYNPDFNAVKWAAASVKKDKKEPRGHLTHIYSDGYTAYGCDGKQMTIAEVEDVPEGYYEIIKNLKTEVIISKVDIDAPVVLANIADSLEASTINQSAIHRHKLRRTIRGEHLLASYGTQADSAMMYNISRAGVCVSFRRVSALVSLCEDLDAYVRGPEKTVLFKDGTRYGYIMPIKMQ